MDKFSALRTNAMQKILEHATTVEVTDTKTFLKLLSDDENMDIIQKMMLLKSIVEALGVSIIENTDDQFTLFNVTGENCLVRKKRYIKRKYRHAVNVVDDSTSSDEEFDSKYTRPYKKYKAREGLMMKKTSIAKNSRASIDPLKYIRDALNAEARLTEHTQAIDVWSRKNSTMNFLSNNELSAPIEQFLDKFSQISINSINYKTGVPNNYRNLQPSRFPPLAPNNTHVNKDSSMCKTYKNELQSLTRVVKKPEIPHMRVTPSTLTNLINSDKPAPEQEPLWQRLHRHHFAPQCLDKYEEETS